LSALTGFFDAHGWILARCLAVCEKSLIENALDRSCGNQSETARLLGIT
jgi:hypothetical protein